MKERIKDLWVTKLRSGKHRQGKNALKTNKGNFCCLGILTLLYCEESDITWSEATLKNKQTLPHKVAMWAGIKENNGAYHPNDEFSRFNNQEDVLSMDNDRYGRSFDDIANIIEAFWEEL